MQIADNTENEDDDDFRLQVRCEFERIHVPELEKRIFVWKYFEGNTISTWPGAESRRVLYLAYNRVLRKIISNIRKKQAANSIIHKKRHER